MKTLHDRRAAACLAVGVFALAAIVATAVRAQAPAVDPAATKILQRMTDYLGSRQQFSVRTQNTLEDLLASGPRVDSDVTATVIVSRPSKRTPSARAICSTRRSTTMADADAVQPVGQGVCDRAGPRHDRGGLDYAREALGVTVPVADLVYRNAFPLLMQDVTLAEVVGKAVIGGARCDHLVFSRPGWTFRSGSPTATSRCREVSRHRAPASRDRASPRS